MPDASLLKPNPGSSPRSDRAAATIASNLHTFGLIAIILAFAAAGRVLVGNQSAATLEEFGRTRVYAIALSSTWFLFAYAFLGLRSNVKTMRQLIDASSWTLRQWGIYALIAIAMFVAWGALGGALRGVLGKVFPARPGAFENIAALLPRTLAEKVLWTALSLSAGFCEEFVYRGYLLQRFFDWTRSILAAIILQAAVYGAAHAALPWQVAASVFFLGLLFGSVAAWKRTLVPGMLMHGVLDALAVVARR